MGQVLHGSATTTAAVRRAIQHSQESLRVLAKRYGINPKTVAKWKQRGSVTERPTGPRGTQINRPFHGRRGHHRGVPTAYAAAAGRLPLCPPGHHPYALQATIPR